MPSVSVIIPAYDAGKTVGKCVESVLSQTMDDLEIIVVDDGSTDDTLEIAERLAVKDSRIKVLSQEHADAGVARNSGIQSATGEYLYFLDADDWIDSSALESMVVAARDNDADVVLCRSRSVDSRTGEEELLDFAVRGLDSGHIYFSGNLDSNLFQCCVGWPWDKLFGADFVRSNGLEFQSLRTSNDALFVFSAMALARRVFVVGDVLVNHRVHGSSSLENTRTRSWDNAFLAADAIDEEFREKGIFKRFEQSYLQWLVHFSLWNYFSLPDEDKVEVIRRILSDVSPKVDALELDDVDDLQVKAAARIFGSYPDEPALVGASLDVCRDYADAAGEAAYWKHRTEALEDEIVRLRRTIQEMRESKDRDLELLRQEILETVRARECERDNIVNSLSFKVGRALTKAPRDLRDRLQGR